MAGRVSAKKALPSMTFELIRDMYGFPVAPQYRQRYQEYADIYKEEEAERSERWDYFLNSHAEFGKSEEGSGQEGRKDHVQKSDSWGGLRPSLWAVEQAMNTHNTKTAPLAQKVGDLFSYASGDDSDEEFYDVERSDTSQEGSSQSKSLASSSPQLLLDVWCPWKEELEPLVQGGVPMALRGELWQVFVGTRKRRVQGHYSALLLLLADGGGESDGIGGLVNGRIRSSYSLSSDFDIVEKWTNQIEKDLPRTFPGHPAFDKDGRNALRRLLTAYARHNPDVGYCQFRVIYGQVQVVHALNRSLLTRAWRPISSSSPWYGNQLVGPLAWFAPLSKYGRTKKWTDAAFQILGYEAMNNFAALLLLLMPEENAFWTLASIIEDCFEGYYSEDMAEAQVDQLVFEDLVREYFPRLADHLNSLGVEVAWIIGPWFLSIFVNILPWDCVLRVWDVLLYEGNRSMLFRISLALIDLHGPAMMATKDAGDAVTLLQSLALATFDSSQLVLIACMGYRMVDEERLQHLRINHRPKVLASLQERAMEIKAFQDSRRAVLSKSSKSSDNAHLVGGKNHGNQNPSVVEDDSGVQGSSSKFLSSHSSYRSGFQAKFATDSVSLQSEEDQMFNLMLLSNGLVPEEESSALGSVEEVKWLKCQLCQTLEENRMDALRAEDLETALVELVKQDNRRLLAAKIETLEEEVSKLKKILAEKEEEEQAMVQVMLKMEQEHILMKEAQRCAEHDATTQRHVVEMMQKNYMGALHEFSTMEKRAIMAESMLEVTLLDYQVLDTGQVASASSLQVSSCSRDEESTKWSWRRMPFSARKASVIQTKKES